MSFQSEPIDELDLVYHRQRLRNRVFDCVLKVLAGRHVKSPFKRADLARKLRRDPAALSRILASPSNLTLDTLSDLLLALEADLPLAPVLLEDLRAANYEHPWADRRHPRPPLMAWADRATSSASGTGEPTIVGTFTRTPRVAA